MYSHSHTFDIIPAYFFRKNTTTRFQNYNWGTILGHLGTSKIKEKEEYNTQNMKKVIGVQLFLSMIFSLQLHKKQFINQTKNRKHVLHLCLLQKYVYVDGRVSMAFEENIALLKCFQQKIRAFCAMLRLQILRYFLRPSLKVGLKVSATQNDAQCTFLIMNAF